MRINAYIAKATGISRRKADSLISAGTVRINGQPATNGSQVSPASSVYLDGQLLSLPEQVIVMLNKPVGYVVSREGQGAKTVYELLPPEMAKLKPVGRLDKDSSGLLILTNDGQLAQKLTHPKENKLKVYWVTLNKALAAKDRQKLELGVELDDGVSKLAVSELSPDRKTMVIKMSEGRNRQIRRSFKVLGYRTVKLHRYQFGDYSLKDLASGGWEQL